MLTSSADGQSCQLKVGDVIILTGATLVVAWRSTRSELSLWGTFLSPYSERPVEI
jgi:hypothetical protein